MKLIQSVLCALAGAVSTLATAASVALNPGQISYLSSDASKPPVRVVVPTSGGGAKFSILSGGSFDGVDINTADGLQGWFNRLGMTVSASDGGRVTLYDLEDAFNEFVVYKTEIRSNWKSEFVVDQSTGMPSQVSQMSGGTFSCGRVAYYASGGSFQQTRLRVDASSKLVFADIAGRRNATANAAQFVFTRQAAPTWSFDSLVGPALPIAALQSATSLQERRNVLAAAGFSVSANATGGVRAIGLYSLTGVRLTPAAIDDLRMALGLLSTGVSALRLTNDGNKNAGLEFSLVFDLN